MPKRRKSRQWTLPILGWGIRLRVSCRLQSPGFTLLEIMVALSVLSIGIVAALELFGTSLRLGAKASGRTQAVIYAQNVMDELFVQQKLEDGEASGEFPGGYVWRASVKEIRPDEDSSSRLQPNQQNLTDFVHLKDIEVTVSWSEGEGSQAFVLRSLRTVSEQPEQPTQ